uniref:Uncharacterized protein n=1 Tax=Oryza sativa subsp. japonica TaxID=39947 RepID=Q69TH9_ORYSJ|nr:hypothetical protein [Oryza sativa Japonica Group]BAD35828.1 hypothetical protein [Oryza sativa Japonica Group]
MEVLHTAPLVVYVQGGTCAQEAIGDPIGGSDTSSGWLGLSAFEGVDEIVNALFNRVSTAKALVATDRRYWSLARLGGMLVGCARGRTAEDHGIATTSNRANYQSKARSDLLDFVGGGGLRCRAPAALHGFGEQQVQAAEARRCRLLEEAADTGGRGGVLSCVGAASSITGGLQRRRQQDLQACTRGRALAAGT